MTDPMLQGRRLLVVEDDYLIAQDIRCHLEDAGDEVIGPMPSVSKALAAIATGTRIDAALLDVNLKGEQVFPVADALAKRRVPFVFTTGYDASALPESYRHVSRCEKPVNMSVILSTIACALKA